MSNRKDERPVAFVTGADRGLGLSLSEALVEKGWMVLAGQYMPEWPELEKLRARFPETLTPIALDVASVESVSAAAREAASLTDRVDLVINNAGTLSQTTMRPVQETQDYEEMHRMYDVNTLGPLRVVEAFLPLCDRGSRRRLCFVSSEAGSIGQSKRTAWFGYCMSKAALNMAVRILFNDLHPRGYTFRLYHPGWIRSYITGSKDMNANLEPEEAAAMALPFFLDPREDEDHLALMDFQGDQLPW